MVMMMRCGGILRDERTCGNSVRVIEGGTGCGCCKHWSIEASRNTRAYSIKDHCLLGIPNRRLGMGHQAGKAGPPGN